MHSTKDRFLLMIEPTLPPSEKPVCDEYTEALRPVMDQAMKIKPNWSDCYRGVHTCSCGAKSTDYDICLPNGQLTNSLAMHYLEYHRDDVPAEELKKITNLHNATPTVISQRKMLNRNGYDDE